MENKMYSIIHGEKVKSAGDVTRKISHNLRLSKPSGFIDQSKTHLNVTLHNKFNVGTKRKSEMREKLDAYYDNLGVTRRKNSVLMFQFYLTASDGFFDHLSHPEIVAWGEHQVEFMKAEFGLNVAHAELQFDEKNPHVHVLLTVEEFKQRNYKNRYGQCSRTGYELNANMINKKRLSDLQTKFADWNKKYGLERGEYDSKKKHIGKNEYIRGLDKLKKENEKLKEFVEQYKELRKTLEAQSVQTKQINGGRNV